MECNKDEAIKARDIAVKKLENNDFEGARKFLEKSKRLYPDIENITQLQAVCDIHIAAQIRLFMTEKDWYSILQVEKIADDVTIKKQYRKLALVLHPDKNKYPGAEAAFKLVGEANMVLSDKGKRSVYDMKIRANVKPPSHAPTQRNPSAKKQQPKTNNSFPNAPNWNQYQAKPNQHPAKPNQPNTSFWTCCPFCGVKYQYYREYVNRALRCQSCSKAFVAHDVGGSNGRQPVNPPKHQASKLQQQGTSVDPKPYFKAPDVKLSQQNMREDLPSSVKADPVIPNKSDKLKNTSKKRGRKVVDESSERVNTSSGESEDVVEESGPYSASIPKKRSSRQKHQVSYNENVDDDDFISSLKRPRVSKEQEMKNKSGKANDEKVKQESVDHPEEKVDQAAKEEKCSADNDLGPLLFQCPDPEFHDFDKEKDETEFSAGQIWACYDTVDGMPRFYAEVKKVFSHKFKLLILWLEADPDTEDEMEWVNEGLPVACGKFERGDSEETSDLPMFSHRVNFEKGKSGRRITYVIFPQKAEIWAIYKNWDMKWSSDPENHKVFELEIVEVISNFSEEGDGIRVCYLERVKGFLSLFKNADISSFLIPRSEFYRFSHKIPSFKMNGTERHGVPSGSFELDPASLPPYLINQVKSETDNVNSKVNGLTTPMKDNRQKVSFEVRRSPRESRVNSKNLNLGNSTQNVPKESFYNFSSEKKFQLGQIWASYKDGLPNKYAQIMKINYPTLQVQYFEPVTENQPSYCGVFKLKTGKEVLSADCFSHMVSSRPITTKGFEVYPKKGEIWAVHQNCTVDVAQSGLKNSEYDVVEVVNDTARATEVSALAKVPGYKSVYKNPRQGVLVILRAEYWRFSHQIPAFQLTEQEGGILKGYWELDPAAIPGPKDKTESKSDTEKMCTPKKPGSRFEKAELRRSPRESKTSIRPSNGTEENSSSCLAAENICVDVDPRPSKLSEELFHDFSQDKSPAKFESSQVWAMYKNGLPKTYAQIKKIEFSKFGLHVQLLESDTLKETSCGIFKRQNLKTLHPPESFSHLVKARVINQVIFEIYPRRGEIWAMFKTWKATSSSNQEKREYEIVEVLEDADQFTKVSSLIRVPGFMSVFKSMRRQKSTSDFLVIPREEFGRFSHQIPFFKLNGEDNGRLRGCWELDPAAVPGDI